MEEQQTQMHAIIKCLSGELLPGGWKLNSPSFKSSLHWEPLAEPGRGEQETLALDNLRASRTWSPDLAG